MRWSFASFRPKRTLTGVRLRYEWALDGTSFARDPEHDGATAAELWRTYVDLVVPRVSAQHGLPADVVPVHWFVSGLDETGQEVVFENAPHQPSGQWPQARRQGQDFLTFYTAPVQEGSREPIDWLLLPVTDSLHRKGDPAGFIQEHLGWKPTVLRSVVDVRRLAEWAGVYYPARPGAEPAAEHEELLGGPLAGGVGWVAG